MPDKVLVVVAHADDEVLGCGGTIARHVSEGDMVKVLIVADGESSRDGFEGKEIQVRRQNNAKKACAIIGVDEVTQLDLPDNQLDTIPLLLIVKQIEAVISNYKPVTVYTHHAGDVNIDHQIVHEATIVATRPQPHLSVENLFFMEVISSTDYRPATSQPPFAPTHFVDVENFTDQKFEALEVYADEMRTFPHARSIKAIEAQLAWRGSSVGLSVAEAFEVGRSVRRIRYSDMQQNGKKK